MSAHEASKTIAGKVTDLFGHRFVLATSAGKVLADLGPKGADLVTLAAGDEVTLTGEQKPTELKVHSVVIDGRTVVLTSDHGDHHHEPRDPAPALAAVKAAGFEVIGDAKRKPKHFEIVGRRGDRYAELHVEFDGSIRKTKPIEKPRDGAGS